MILSYHKQNFKEKHTQDLFKIRFWLYNYSKSNFFFSMTLRETVNEMCFSKKDITIKLLLAKLYPLCQQW